MSKKQIHHLNDRTMKYLSLAETKRQHEYFELPGNFKIRLPQEVVFPNMESGRADMLYFNDENTVFDFEEESGDITDTTRAKFVKYLIFVAFMYSKMLYLAVLCHKDPKKEFEYYQYSDGLIIKINYYYISQEELWAKYENIIKKVEQKIELSDKEAMDIAFVSKFISKEYAPHVVETMAKMFNDAIINDRILKIDVGVILGGMILKNILDEDKQNKLLDMINMRHIKSEIEKIVYDEYGDELDAKDKIIETKDKELKTKDKELKTKDKELKTKDNEIDSLNKSKSQLKNKAQQLNEQTHPKLKK